MRHQQSNEHNSLKTQFPESVNREFNKKVTPMWEDVFPKYTITASITMNLTTTQLL